MLMEDKALVSREAYSQAMGCSTAISSLQTQLIAAMGCIDTLEARDPAHTDDPEESDRCTSTAAELVFSFISVSNYHKMVPRRGTRTRTRIAPAIATTTATATTPMTMTDAAIRALIARGVADALAKQEVHINTNLIMETVFHISNYALENQVKFTTCSLHGVALTWWNSYVKTVGHDAAYSMPWKTLMKTMTTKRMFPEESDVVKKYVVGLPNMIQGNVMSTKPKILEEAIEMANNLMDQKLHTLAER
ncbi:hypothetical protein Tco_0209607 [Tanacetum coccineum]